MALFMPDMRDGDRQRLEADVRALCDQGDYAAAATATLRGYGPELLGFLVAVHRSELDAGDGFSELSEVIWRKLPTFAWESTLRTWAYGIARNVSRTLRRNARRRGRREGGAGESALEAVAIAVRTATLTYLRTEKRTRLQALRDLLPEEDRMLLVLRVDRNLEWNDLARVLGERDGDATLEGAVLAREAARLRKRFQLVKDKLRELARREKLVD
jgi:RNA polymerase sigma-70 factor (ECF subfamily)